MTDHWHGVALTVSTPARVVHGVVVAGVMVGAVVVRTLVAPRVHPPGTQNMAKITEIHQKVRKFIIKVVIFYD